ncbi:very long chain fatty acid elongase 4-like [Tubulanus polymorphus]|uniref:very long chain fatty acid elongase 4-like n=1 Tax=Tubulanus polymorphus TaxID=672921 RepID=UPI003DA56148
MEKFAEMYKAFLAKGDPRTEKWLFVETPVPALILSSLYILVSICGPRFMKNRKPLNLKALIIPYNFALVGLSSFIFYEILATAIKANYSLRCEPVDYSNNPLALRMANATWWFFFSKFIELFDTIFMILRGKTNQLSFLHVYHHSTIIPNYWLAVRFAPGGQAFFAMLLNSFVHVLMYTYYGLSALGPEMRKYLWWKKYMTRIQLVQFCLFFTHGAYNYFLTDCDFPAGLNLLVLVYSTSLIVLFMNFYIREYIHKQNEKKTK